jgi:hypothetical protein
MNKEKIIYTFGLNDCGCIQHPCKCEPYAIFKNGEKHALTGNRRNARDISAYLNEGEFRAHYRLIEAESEDIGKFITGLHLSRGETLEFPESKLKLRVRNLK